MLEEVVPDTSDRLREAVRHFIRIKRALNNDEPKPAGYLDWAASLNPDVFIDRSMPDHACWPASTLRNVLPFFDSRDRDESVRRPASVPVAQVLGSSFKWPEYSVPKPMWSTEECRAYFSSEDRINDHEASVTLVRQLGVFFVSGEGKNRVAFLARCGVEFMPCWLTEIDYPEADRLKVIDVFEGPLRTWLCVLDDAFICSIPYPEFTLPLLDAYGVVRSKDWPYRHVMPTTVLNCLRRQRGDHFLHGMRSDVVRTPLELLHLAELERVASEQTSEWGIATAHEKIAFDWRRWVVVFCVLIVCAGVFGVFEPTRPVSIFTAGALFAWLGVWLVRVRVRHEHVPDAVIAAGVAERLSERGYPHSVKLPR